MPFNPLTEIPATIDLAFYRSILNRCFPSLPVQTIEFAGGSSSRVFRVNGNLYFRFPHSDTGVVSVRHERAVYELLAGKLPLPIPSYEWYSEGVPGFPYPIAGSRAVPGASTANVSLSPAAGAQIGSFAAALHLVTLPQPWLSPPLRPGDGQREGINAYYGQAETPAASARRFLETHRRAFDALSASERSWVTDFFDQFCESEAARTPAPVRLVHGDLEGGNFLYEPASGLLTGVIDFESAGPGDPAIDLVPALAEYGRPFYEAALEAYNTRLKLHGREQDGWFRDRVEFRSRTYCLHEISFGVLVGAQSHIKNGLERLRRSISGAAIIGGWAPIETAADRRWGAYG